MTTLKEWAGPLNFRVWTVTLSHVRGNYPSHSGVNPLSQLLYGTMKQTFGTPSTIVDESYYFHLHFLMFQFKRMDPTIQLNTMMET